MGFFDKLKNGLSKTENSFDEKINNVFSNFIVLSVNVSHPLPKCDNGSLCLTVKVVFNKKTPCLAK